MNLPQAKVLLEKVITLYKTLSADEKNISPIERDLMLSYIRQLYETFLDTPSVSTPQRNVQYEPRPEPLKFAPPPPVVEQPNTPPPPPVVEQIREQSKPVEPPRYTPPPPVVEPPRYTPPPPPVVEQPRYTPPPPVVEQPRYTPPPAEMPRFAQQNASVPSDIEALFEGGSSGKELSDRLSNTAIADLSKAFGLNDRLLTQNELFGGSKAVFDEALKDLNNMSSFDTAKNVLVAMAVRYNWTANDDRKKQAKSFIKLVRRRFS
jgi:hypothetical protein